MIFFFYRFWFFFFCFVFSRTKDENKSELNEIKIGTLTRMTKEEYINLFLHFHSSLFLKGDLETARKDLPRLSSALSMLVATTTLTRSSLVQVKFILPSFFSLSSAFVDRLYIKMDVIYMRENENGWTNSFQEGLIKT